MWSGRRASSSRVTGAGHGGPRGRGRTTPPCSPTARPTGGSNRWPSRPTGGRYNAAPQSPLTDPDTKAGKAFRAVRVLAGDTATGQPTAEYVYLLEDVASFDPVAKGDQSEIKISALAWHQPDC